MKHAPLPYSADLRSDAFLRACHDVGESIEPLLIHVPREVDEPENYAIAIADMLAAAYGSLLFE